MSRVFIDTNVLVYAMDQADPIKRETAIPAQIATAPRACFGR